MKAKAFTLSIAKPCHEDWDAMSPEKNGKFCASCSKVVVDFTSMSQELIEAYFKNSKGNLCGKFKKSQLESTYTFTYRNPFSFNTTLLRWSLAGILTFSGVKGFSQSGSTTKTTSTVDNSGKKNGVTKTVITNTVTMGETKSVPTHTVMMGKPKLIEKEPIVVTSVLGQVAVCVMPGLQIRMNDKSTGKALSSGQVYVKETKSTFYVDKTGGIEIKLPDSLKNKSVTLTFSSGDFESVTKTVDLKSQGKAPLIVQMDKFEMQMKGEVQFIPADKQKTNCPKKEK
jgi:hypothetical protein